MKVSALLVIISSLLLHSFPASALKKCGYRASPEFCEKEQYFQCRGVRDTTFDAVLRLKTIGSTPYLLKRNGDAIGSLRFEYQIWATFDDGFKYYASERHHETGRNYENGVSETRGPQVTTYLYETQFGPIERASKYSNHIRNGLLLEMQRESGIVRGRFDFHYFLLHAIPEEKRFYLYWYSYDTPYSPLNVEARRRIETSVCRPVKVK